jgi:hypothetical protein
MVSKLVVEKSRSLDSFVSLSSLRMTIVRGRQVLELNRRFLAVHSTYESPHDNAR